MLVSTPANNSRSFESLQNSEKEQNNLQIHFEQILADAEGAISNYETQKNQHVQWCRSFSAQDAGFSVLNLMLVSPERNDNFICYRSVHTLRER